MASGFFVFIFLYAVIWFFERKNNEPNPLDVLIVAMVPSFVLVAAHFGGLFLGYPEWFTFVPIFLYVVALFTLIVKMLELRPRRAAAYTVAASVFMAALSIMMELVIETRT